MKNSTKNVKGGGAEGTNEIQFFVGSRSFKGGCTSHNCNGTGGCANCIVSR